MTECSVVLFQLCFILNCVYTTNENAAVSHYINLIIFTLPPLSASGANKILLMLHDNLTPFSGTQKHHCVSRRKLEITNRLHRHHLAFMCPLFKPFRAI